MDSIIQQTIQLLKEQSQSSILATPEEAAYFSPAKKGTAPVKKTVEMDREMQQMVQKVLAEAALIERVPDDAAAKKLAHLYKEEHLAAQVLVLSFGETGPALQFLQNVAKAIEVHLAPAKLVEMRKIERENSWEMTLSSPALKLIVAPPFAEWKTISLARFYRENPSTKSHLLKETPLLLTQPVSAYLKNPDLKRELWKTLSTLLSTSTQQ